jgi:phage terminase large subunit GpA-like protein
VVPPEARFLVAFADVQGGKNARFVVQVHAVGPHKEQWLVDRYAITESDREGMDGRKAPLDPAAHPEDWDVLKKRVLDSTYRTTHEGLEMRVKKLVYDTGGEDGVTAQAYAFYRRMRREGLHQRVRPAKGASTKVEWHVRETMVGGEQGAGDVPLLLFDPNKFKDMVSAGRQRREPGPGYYHWPDWLPSAFFDELNAEVRNENGVWEQIKKRNESLDCCVGVLVACTEMGVDKREFWHSPPAWALPQTEGNSEMVLSEVRRAEHQAVQRPVLQRRVQRSSYLG